MRALIQRVTQASVSIAANQTGKIERGMVVFVGIKKEDNKAKSVSLADKILNLRIFPDDNDKMNLSILDIKGEILVVSQFTLYGNCQQGRRPDFAQAASPPEALELYNEFIKYLKNSGLKISSGVFGAKMLVDIYNDGPVTFMLEID